MEASGIRPSDTIRPAESPLPSTAFTGPPASSGEASGPEIQDRFATKHIASDDSNQTARAPFHGPLVDLDVAGADIHDVFRLLADVARVNIVVGSDITGKVTMRLRRVPCEQVMDVIARAHGLTYERDGNVIVVRR